MHLEFFKCYEFHNIQSRNAMFSVAELPPLQPASTWTSVDIKELKAKLKQEKDSVVTVYRGDIMTIHVPTTPEAKRVCWEFATDGYDIGFGVYFDWSPVTNQAITVHISESSDDEDEDELEGESFRFKMGSVANYCPLQTLPVVPATTAGTAEI